MSALFASSRLALLSNSASGTHFNNQSGKGESYFFMEAQPIFPWLYPHHQPNSWPEGRNKVLDYSPTAGIRSGVNSTQLTTLRMKERWFLKGSLGSYY